jgi:hypothetical protein
MKNIVKAVVAGGLAIAVLDAIDALVAYKVVLGFDPVPIYQFVASGLLGPSAFQGGIPAALLGLAVHFAVAFSAATVYVLASTRVPALRRAFAIAGPAFGVGVYFFMNAVVIPLSRIPPSPFSPALFVNGVLGHALLVGLPAAYFARRYLPAPGRGAGPASRPADVELRVTQPAKSSQADVRHT